MLGKAVHGARLGVLALEALAVIATISGIAYMTMGSGVMMDKIAARMTDDIRLNNGEIATGGNIKKLKAEHTALLSKSALPGEASRNADKLHVGLVSFRDNRSLDAAGYSSATLRVGKLSAASTLIIADGPTHWTIANSRIDQRAKLAFEGASPVRVSHLPQGFLAGTRIKPFDAKRVSEFSSLDEDQNSFCRTMGAWSGFFGVSLDDISVSKIYVAAGTPQVNVGDRGFKSPGGRVVRQKSAGSVCEKRHRGGRG